MPFRAPLLLCVDLAAWLLGFAAAIPVRPIDDAAWPSLAMFSVVVVLQLIVGRKAGLYSGRYRVGGFDEAVVLATVWLLVAIGTAGATAALSPEPASTIAMRALVWSTVALISMLVLRSVWRVVIERSIRPGVEGRSRAVVVGAGEAGYMIVRGMLTDPASLCIPVALLDDDPAKARRSLMGVRVAGTVDELLSVTRRFDATVVIVAIPSASSELIGRIVAQAKGSGIDVRTLPPMSELASDTVTLRDIRPLNASDLLGRAEVDVDMVQIRHYLTGKRVLVTGAGGSIGSELCRQLHKLDLQELIMLDRDETGLHSTQLSIEGRALLDAPDLVVADIRDRERIFTVFAERSPDVVFHAAALKHLTLLERHPCEGVKTNVLGSRNVIDAAVACGVECLVNVSTDKAADPTSVLGATKLLAEQLAARAATRSTGRIVSVRFGNVLGSRGSVLPTFLHQIESGGPVTVTDPDVTRYFMTIPEAVRLVLQAGAIGCDGEILILDMGEPVRIADLAQRLIDYHNAGVEIEYTGLRPGEKLHEVLVAENESGERRSHPRIVHSRGAPIPDLDEVVAKLAASDAIDARDVVGLVELHEHGQRAS